MTEQQMINAFVKATLWLFATGFCLSLATVTITKLFPLAKPAERWGIVFSIMLLVWALIYFYPGR